MALSNAEKQRRYRENRCRKGNIGDYRLNTYITGESSFALGRLAKHYNLTKRQVLELLITTADKTISKKLEIDSKEWNKYWNIEEDE